MSNRPIAGDVHREARSSEDPGNFKRTPSTEEVQEDPLDSGRRFTSNQILVGSVVAGSALGVGLALVFL